MAFCVFNSESIINGKTFLDNIFITQYMPYLSTNSVKVFTYGHFMCQNANNIENSLSSFCKNISLPESAVLESFEELEKNGLVQIVRVENCEPEIIFIPCRDVLNNIKKYDEKLFSSFNVEIQNTFPKNVAISSNQYNEFYNLMDIYKIEQGALVLIAKYCANLKGEKVNPGYVCAVAKNFALNGARTVNQVNNYLLELEQNSGKIKEVLNAMKIFRSATHEEFQTYSGWKQNLGFDEDLIIYSAIASKSKSFKSLDKIINHYYKMGLFSKREIESYEQTRKIQMETAMQSVKNLGLFYESLDPVVENYISVWFNKGLEPEFITTVAKMCFKQGLRTLEKMDEKINTFYEKGIINLASLEEFSAQVSAKDEKIKQILKSAGIARNLTLADRSFYNTWSTSWQIGDELILHAASLSKDAVNPFAYMNIILKSYKEQGISTAEQAKKLGTKVPEKPQINKVQIEQKCLKQIVANYASLEDEYYNKIANLRKTNIEFKNLDETLRKQSLICAQNSNEENKQKLEKIEKQVQEYLVKNEITKPEHICKKCADTGFVKNKRCECLINLISDELAKLGNIENV